MNIEEARRILGLRPGEEASEHLGEFVAAREQIADLVRMAPNDTIALRYQEGLMEFDRALAAVREELERVATGGAAEPAAEPPETAPLPASAPVVTELPPIVERPAVEQPVSAVVPVFAPVAEPVAPAGPAVAAAAAEPAPKVLEDGSPPSSMASTTPLNVPLAAAEPGPAVVRLPAEAALAEEEVIDLPSARRRRFPYVAVATALLLLSLGGGWVWLRLQEDLRLQKEGRIVFLERQGSILLDNRRWDEAGAAYREIEELDPGSPLAALGRRSIEAGMAEEANQYFGYWQGEALAAFEAGRWEDAEKAIRMVTARMPDNREMLDLERRITQARRERERAVRLERGRKAIEANRWEEAAAVAREMLDLQAGDRDAGELLLAANAGRERERENLAKARELVALAQKRDTGEFDEQALEWVREAARLAPGDPEVAALYQKLSGYTRMLRVPGDHATIGAAIAAARPKDRIQIGKGIWKEHLVLDRVVELEGAGSGETVIECPAGDGPVIMIGSEAAGARVSGAGFRHTGFAGGAERFSVAVVCGGRVVLEGCRFANGSGHGLAVTEGAVVSATGCAFEDNGWDGVAVYGAGSRVELADCLTNGNIEHGVDVWGDATAVVRGTTARGNGRNGICVQSPAEVVIDRNKAEENREFGVVVVAANGGQVTTNQLARNALGGAAFHRTAKGLTIRGNRATRNEGPGFVFDEGFAAAALEANEATENHAPRQIMENVKLDAAPDAGEGKPK